MLVLRIAAGVVGVAGVSGMGCSSEPQTIGSSVPATLATAVPIPSASLDRVARSNGGLLTGLGPDGWPLLSGPGVDPLVLETRRYYDSIGAPAGVPTIAATTAPTTIDEWKRAFGFSAREPGETVAAFRARTNVVVYYNKNELGLGRELGCAKFADGKDAAGNDLVGAACYVTNYGALFGDAERSLAAAIEGQNVRNTVCISYRPSAGAGYEVQFYVYRSDGQRQDWAQLDSLGPRPHPLVCTNCHGGKYDDQQHRVAGAHFLPLDPNLVVFAADDDPDVSRSAQEERIRLNNELAFTTPLTDAQRNTFQGLYSGQIASPGQRSTEEPVPPGWDTSARERTMYQQVVRPYCATCHLAMDPRQSAISAFFDSAAKFRTLPVPEVMCNGFGMPNSQATMHGFWGEGAPAVTVEGVTHATAADAMLDWFGRTRDACAGLAEMSTCARGPDADRICGDAHSGTACNLDTGKCVPAMVADPAATSAATSSGVCRMDGSRACPYWLECRPATATELFGLAGYDGVCAPCGGAGETVCRTGLACGGGLAANGSTCEAALSI